MVYDHGGDLLAVGTGDGEAAAAVAGVVPAGAGEGGAVDAAWESVPGEGAGSASYIAALNLISFGWIYVEEKGLRRRYPWHWRTASCRGC